MKTIYALATGVAWCALTSACSTDLPEYDHVEGFRLLTIAADHPTPQKDQETTVSALVVGGESLEYRWSWCPFSAGAFESYRCLFPQDGLGAGWPSYELGTSEQAKVSFPASPEQIERLCQELSMLPIPDGRSPMDCSLGLSVLVKLELKAQVNGELREVIAVKRLMLLSDPDTAHINTNPQIGAFSVRLENDGSGQDSDSLQWLKKYDCSLSVSEDMVEEYPDEMGLMTSERLVVTWFRSGGTIKNTRTAYLPSEDDFTALTKNTFELEEEDKFQGDEMKFYLVLRDDRGGVSWMEKSYPVKEKN